MNIKAYENIIEECKEISKAKNSDYNQCVDAIVLGGLDGIAIRLLDKVARINSLVRGKEKRQVKDESVRDTLLDVINYAVYGVMLLDGTWVDPVKELCNQIVEEISQQEYDARKLTKGCITDDEWRRKIMEENKKPKTAQLGSQFTRTIEENTSKEIVGELEEFEFDYDEMARILWAKMLPWLDNFISEKMKSTWSK